MGKKKKFNNKNLNDDELNENQIDNNQLEEPKKGTYLDNIEPELEETESYKKATFGEKFPRSAVHSQYCYSKNTVPRPLRQETHQKSLG